MSNKKLIEEKKQLCNILPDLLEKKLSLLSQEQLQLLHYILGYNTSKASVEVILEAFEQNDYDDVLANEIIAMLDRMGFSIIENPY